LRPKVRARSGSRLATATRARLELPQDPGVTLVDFAAAQKANRDVSHAQDRILIS
jgi:hypothetical protein